MSEDKSAVVIGGGIGGLAAAVALRAAGYGVTVLEQARELAEVGAGIGLNPNAVGALTALGVSARLQPRVVTPSWSVRRRWQDGRELIRVDLEETKERFGYPFWFVHRGDLQRALRDTATDPTIPGPPVALRLGTKVTDVDATGTVRTADNGIVTGDVIVAADGIASRVRERLFTSDPPTYSGQTVYRAQIPYRSITDAPDLAAIVEDANFETWLGPGGHVVHCPFRSGEVLNFTGSFAAPPIGDGVRTAPASHESFLHRTEGWAPEIRRLAERAPAFFRYDIYLLPRLPLWSRGKVALIGDSAHPMMPYLGQGAAQAIEDAEFLGAALAVADPEDAFPLYEEVRQARAARVQEASATNGHLFHLPDGPEQRERDEAIAQGSRDGDVTSWLWKYQNPAEKFRGHTTRSK